MQAQPRDVQEYQYVVLKRATFKEQAHFPIEVAGRSRGSYRSIENEVKFSTAQKSNLS